MFDFTWFSRYAGNNRNERSSHGHRPLHPETPCARVGQRTADRPPAQGAGRHQGACRRPRLRPILSGDRRGIRTEKPLVGEASAPGARRQGPYPHERQQGPRHRTGRGGVPHTDGHHRAISTAAGQPGIHHGVARRAAGRTHRRRRAHHRGTACRRRHAPARTPDRHRQPVHAGGAWRFDGGRRDLRRRLRGHSRTEHGPERRHRRGAAG